MTHNIIFYKHQSGIHFTSNASSAMTTGLNALITTRKEQIYRMEEISLILLKHDDVGKECT
jgi:hypothetical protein